MSFAILRWAKSKDEIHINEFIKKAPEPLYDFYIQKKNPFRYKSLSLLNRDGYEIFLPLLKEEAEKGKKLKCVVDKTMECFENIKSVWAPVELYSHINEKYFAADGRGIFALFLTEAVKKALKILEKPLKTAEFIVLDGGGFLAEIIIDILHPHVNFLAVLTKNTKKFYDKEKEIFEEYGLNIEILPHYNTVSLNRFDVVINTDVWEENLYYHFKHRSVYFELAGKSPADLVIRRKDLLIVDGLELYCEQHYITPETLEAAFFSASLEYRKLLTKNVRQINECSRQLKSLNVYVTSLLCMGKNVGT